jgi:hypothetical protein
LNAIKKEIHASYPKLITIDKPFHAVLAQYEPGHIQAVVNCHFHGQSTTDASFDKIRKGSQGKWRKFCSALYSLQNK